MHTETPPLPPSDNQSVRRWLLVNLGVPAVYVAAVTCAGSILKKNEEGLLMVIVMGLAFIVLMAALNISVAIALGRGNAFAAFFIWAGSTALSIAVAWAGCAILASANLL